MSFHERIQFLFEYLTWFRFGVSLAMALDLPEVAAEWFDESGQSEAFFALRLGILERRAEEAGLVKEAAFLRWFGEGNG